MIRKGNLSLRIASTINREPKKYLEIVEWFAKDSCYTIASWSTDKDNSFASLNYCMDRPLSDTVDNDKFNELVKIGYDIYNFAIGEDEGLL